MRAWDNEWARDLRNRQGVQVEPMPDEYRRFYQQSRMSHGDPMDHGSHGR
jgi:hypothetical protein